MEDLTIDPPAASPADAVRFTAPVNPDAPDAPRMGAITLNGVEWSTVIPPDAGDLRTAYEAWVAQGNAPAEYEPSPSASVIQIYKAPLFRRMTDAEYEQYLQIREAFPPRMQAIFDAAEYLSSDDEFWPDLVAAAEQAYGVERAAELLAPTT